MACDKSHPRRLLQLRYPSIRYVEFKIQDILMVKRVEFELRETPVQIPTWIQSYLGDFGPVPASQPNPALHKEVARIKLGDFSNRNEDINALKQELSFYGNLRICALQLSEFLSQT